MHLAMPFAQLHAQLVALLGRQLSLRRGIRVRRSLLAQFMSQHFALMRRHALATVVGKHALHRQNRTKQYRGQNQVSLRGSHPPILCKERALRLARAGKPCNKP